MAYLLTIEFGDVALDVSLLPAPVLAAWAVLLAAGVGAGSGAAVVLRAGRTGVGSTGAADAWTDVRLAGTGAAVSVTVGAGAGAAAGAGAGVVVVVVAAGAFAMASLFSLLILSISSSSLASASCLNTDFSPVG